MNNQKRRIYPYSDAYMLSSSELISTFYIEYYPAFATFDPILFVEGYGATLQELINTGFSVERDSLITDQVSKEGADVTTAIEIFFDNYDDLTYYVDKCFAEDLDIHKQFYHRSVSLLKKSPAELILWSEELNIATENHKDTLLASGYTEEAFTKFLAAKAEVRKHYLEQQEALKRRPEKTAERVAIFNKLWTMILEINEAAKRIYRKQPEILALFELPKVQHKRADKEEHPSDPAVYNNN